MSTPRAGLGLADAGGDLVAGADRYGRFVDDDLVIGHVLGDRFGDGEHVLQVGRAVLVGRGADGDELDLAEIDAGLGVGRELSLPASRLRLTISARPGS
jgi:hypothetical protein